MSVYPDTSVWVSGLTEETWTERSQAWLAATPRSGLATSDWVWTEVSSALARKLRMGALRPDTKAAAWVAFQRLVTGVEVVSLGRTHFHEAARLCQRPDLNLRAGDAIHLAVVLERGDVLCTLDRGLAEAAKACGVVVTQP